MPLHERVAPLRARPAATALLFDFDGTLAPIVTDPAQARAADGVLPRLGALAAAYRTVGVLSGRPVAFLAQRVPPGVALSGLYGLEERRGPSVRLRDDVAAWLPKVEEAVRRATIEAAAGAPLAGMVVEPKGASLTLHTRTAPALGDASVAFARRVGAELGLEVRPAKMSVELHPPVPADKGTALRELAAGCEAVLYVGDDVGDLPAYDALAGLRGEGVRTLAVAVGGPELPDAVRAAADVVLGSQAEVLDLLDALLP